MAAEPCGRKDASCGYQGTTFGVGSASSPKTRNQADGLRSRLQASDLDALLLIFTDPSVMASFEVEHLAREQMQGWLQRKLDHHAEFGCGLYSIIHKSTGLLIGDCGLEQMELDGVQAAELVGFGEPQEVMPEKVRSYVLHHLHGIVVTIGMERMEVLSVELDAEFPRQHGRTKMI